MAIAAIDIDSLSGLTIKDYNTVRTAFENAYRGIFGNGINLDPSAPDGQLVDLFAYAYTELAQALQTVVANMDIATAEGVFLEFIGKPVGITRKTGETDTELRARIQVAAFDGLATFDAMLTYLRQNVHKDTSIGESESDNKVYIYIPEAMSVDLIPENDEDWIAIQQDVNRSTSLENFIAQKIWNCKGAGIKTGGNRNDGVAIDRAGNYHTVAYSQVASVPFQVSVSITEYSEERLPYDYADQIKAAIVAWAAENLKPGNDVIPGRFSTPIYSIEGIDEIETKVKVKVGGTWSSKRTPVGPENCATIAAEDIEVTLVG